MKHTIFFILIIFIHSVLYSQNIGIGITNPTRAKLEVHGAVDATTAIFDGNGTGISLTRNYPGIDFNAYYNSGHRYLADGYGANQYLDPVNGNMGFEMFGNGIASNLITSNRNAMYFTKTGRVVLGATNQLAATLNVGKNNVNEPAAYFFGSNFHSSFHWGAEENTYIRAGKNAGTVYINDIPGSTIAFGGSVGIGITAPSYPLEVKMTAGPITKGMVLLETTNFNAWHYTVPGNPVLSLAFNGVNKGYFDYNSGNYFTYSDRRIKTAIEPLTGVLEKVKTLQPVSYQMIHSNPTHKRSLGFIAQDVKNIFPQLVAVQQDTSAGYNHIQDLHTMNYRAFAVVAIAAIKEQQSIINAQEVELKLLESELDAIENTVFKNTCVKIETELKPRRVKQFIQDCR